MSHRKNRVWLGATRIASLILLTLAIAATGATTSWGYMPPPVQAPNVLPSELPGEEQYVAGQGEVHEEPDTGWPSERLPNADRETNWFDRAYAQVLRFALFVAGAK